jgi:hypothetical protein
MNPGLHRAKQVESGRATLGARVELDPSDLLDHHLVVEKAGSGGFGNGLIEDVGHLLARRPRAGARAARGTSAAAPPVPPRLLPYPSFKKHGERAVPDPVWVL